jgi:hypothetical protein
MNALTKTEADTNVVALVESPPTESLPPDSLLNFVAMAVRDPSVDVTKLEALLRMQREIVADDGRVQFYRSLGAFAAEVPQIAKAGRTDKYKFAKREDMDDIIRPLLTKHGLVLSFRPVSSSLEAITVEGELVHVQSGYAKTAQFTMPPDFGPGRNNLQAFGSAKAYAERYLTEMLCGLVRCDEDQDGNRPSPRAANDDGRMNAAQLKLLDDLMIQTNTGEGKFLAYHKLDYRSIQQVPASEFVRLKNALLGKVSMLAQRAALQARNKDARS